MADAPADTADHAADAAHGAEAAAHGGEHAAAFPPFDASLFASQLIWFALTFAALYFVVARMVLPTVARVQARRAGTIASDLDTAAKKGAEADAARQAMEKAVASARAEARATIDAARADVMAKLAADQQQAETRLLQRIETAETRVDAARQSALAEVPAIAEALAREIADKIAPQGAGKKPARQRVAGDA